MIIALIGAILFFIIMVLYIALAFGAPLGEFALGGKYKTLPKKMRIICAESTLIQVLAIFVLLQLGDIFSIGFPHYFAKILGYLFSSYLLFNIFLNCKSKSKKEKYIMTPLSIIIFISFLITSIVS